jgi:zinc/manganese transport system substrate-binding protein
MILHKKNSLRALVQGITVIAATLTLAFLAHAAHAALDVVTTTPELAAITREVGGDLVKVTSLAKPNQDYHRIEAKPTDVVKVKNADVFIRVGLDLDMWADAVMNAARNAQVQPGGKGYVDAGRLIRRMEVPTTNISGASGDVHVYGNPHYWLAPGNAKVVAYEIDLALRAVDPKNATTYDANYSRFSAEIDKRLAGWKQDLAPYQGRPVVAYHDEWVYFLNQFGLKAFGYLEPKPGIPPSGSHVNSLIAAMKRDNVKAVILMSIYPTRFGDLISREAGGKVSVVPYSVGSLGTTDYFSYMDAIVSGFKKALQ